MKIKIDNLFLVFNRQEWLMQGWWTELELAKADESGFIGTKYGIDCYLPKYFGPDVQPKRYGPFQFKLTRKNPDVPNYWPKNTRPYGERLSRRS